MAKAAVKKPLSGGVETRTISLRLLRKDRTIEDAVRAIAKLKEQPTTSGRLYYSQSDDATPSWLGLVNQFAEIPLMLANKSCAAVLFLDVASGSGTTRTFALAFGGGHLTLHADAFERNFGLKVALNSIARADLHKSRYGDARGDFFQKRVPEPRDSISAISGSIPSMICCDWPAACRPTPILPAPCQARTR